MILQQLSRGGDDGLVKMETIVDASNETIWAARSADPVLSRKTESACEERDIHQRGVLE